MKLSQMVLILILTVNISYGSISDTHNVATDGILSKGEYGGHVIVTDLSEITVSDGGANWIDIQDYSHLEVTSTSKPLISNESGVNNIYISDNSTVTFSGGIANYIYVLKDAAAIINGGQVNLIRSIQKPTAGETITIECCEGWSWLYDNEGEINGITGQWYKYGNDEFSIKFLNDTIQYKYPDTYTHVKVVTPEPATIVLLTLGGLLAKRNRQS